MKHTIINIKVRLTDIKKFNEQKKELEKLCIDTKDKQVLDFLKWTENVYDAIPEIYPGRSEFLKILYYFAVQELSLDVSIGCAKSKVSCDIYWVGLNRK